MKQILQQLRAAQDYASEQKDNDGLPLENRQAYEEDAAFLEDTIQSILSHFGTPDEDDHWFWRGDHQ